jgi:hypothetical protein
MQALISEALQARLPGDNATAFGKRLLANLEGPDAKRWLLLSGIQLRLSNNICVPFSWSSGGSQVTGIGAPRLRQ